MASQAVVPPWHGPGRRGDASACSGGRAGTGGME